MKLMKSIEEYLEAQNNIGKVLYYPGAHTDFGPMLFFKSNSSIDTVIYTDYLIEEKTVFESIEELINNHGCVKIFNK